jgi:hypothetical protein
LNCTNPISPYADWTTAATNIQDAVDASTNGDLILVTNGIYATGGRKWYDSGTNRVTLTNAVTLQSVNGPAVTQIVGGWVAGTGSILTNAVRCVAMGNNAVLSGFTLTNGEAGWGNYPNGGGMSQVLSISAAGTVTNCVLINNLSTNGIGGGAYRVRLVDCQIIGNYAIDGGGACACTLINCTVVSNNASSGGGVYGSTTYGASVLSNCTLVGNFATGSGGGAYNSTLNNSLITSNRASLSGGGAYSSVLNNCILKFNYARNYGGGAVGSTLINCTVVNNATPLMAPGQTGGGGVAGCSLTNCILNYNSGGGGSNFLGSTMSYCSTTPLPTNGVGNITNEPAFVDLANGDFHLQSNSPCINAGNNSYVTNSTDFDGNPRIVGGTVDMGAYEFQSPSSVLSYAWAQQYGLPTDGTADYADTDGDGMNNWQEWKTGTNPTNASSVLRMSSLAATNSLPGLVVTWQSVSGINYFLQSSTDLGAQPAFSTIQSNIVGQAGTTSYTDTTATNGGSYFYRVGVQ